MSGLSILKCCSPKCYIVYVYVCPYLDMNVMALPWHTTLPVVYVYVNICLHMNVWILYFDMLHCQWCMYMYMDAWTLTLTCISHHTTLVHLHSAHYYQFSAIRSTPTTTYTGHLLANVRVVVCTVGTMGAHSYLKVVGNFHSIDPLFGIFDPIGSLCYAQHDLIDFLFLQKKSVCLYHI